MTWGNIWLFLTDGAEIWQDNPIGVMDNLGKGCGIILIPGRFFFCVLHDGPIY